MHQEVLNRTRWQLLKNAEYLDTEDDEKRELDETLKRNQSLTIA